MLGLQPIDLGYQSEVARSCSVDSVQPSNRLGRSVQDVLRLDPRRYCELLLSEVAVLGNLKDGVIGQCEMDRSPQFLQTRVWCFEPLTAPLPEERMRRLFRAKRDLTGNFPGLPDVVPDVMAPVVHTAPDGERELSMMRWGFPPPPNPRQCADNQRPQREVALLARLAQRPFANGRMASESAAVVMERARRRWARDTRNRA
jgi:hypothetical protein